MVAADVATESQRTLEYQAKGGSARNKSDSLYCDYT